uniref:Lipoprotein n=1 Tax=Polynucleobacter necessarius subsp. necessarius (strain STIR1) TaxID=452638 RepID=B1XTE1_POLNS
MRLMRSIEKIIPLLCLSTMGLVACVSFPSENQDPAKNNKTAYNKDLKECKEDYPESGSGVHLRQWMGCMQLKGWK